MVGACLSCNVRNLAGRFLLLPAVLAFLGLNGARAEAPVPAKETKLPEAVTKTVPENIEDLKAIQKQVHTVLDKVIPATVGVRIGASSGSGVIISEDGYVLTAGHVSGAPGRDAIMIFPDGKQVKAKSLGSNKAVDSGLFKITEEGKWPFVEMGKSATLTRGQWCITIGHPGGFRPGRTPVVRLGRILEKTDATLRTDCTLVGGDSGGPLFDLEGKVIGIHSRIGGVITVNLHVPVDNFHDGWDRLVKGEVWGGFERPSNAAYMGVELDREGEGCKITRVVEDTPAAKAGLKNDDMIIELDGKKIGSSDDLSVQLRTRKPNDQITVKVQRAQETLTLKVTLAKRPS
jgi:serine protease Do